jgi:hypothetical protein
VDFVSYGSFLRYLRRLEEVRTTIPTDDQWREHILQLAKEWEQFNVVVSLIHIRAQRTIDVILRFSVRCTFAVSMCIFHGNKHSPIFQCVYWHSRLGKYRWCYAYRDVNFHSVVLRLDYTASRCMNFVQQSLRVLVNAHMH